MLLASEEHQHSQMFQVLLACKAWSSLSLIVNSQIIALAVSI